MTTLKIENRKNTTEKALEELQALINNLNGKIDDKHFSDDVNAVSSIDFYGKINVDNGKYTNDCYYDSWTNHTAYWTIKNGTLRINSESTDYNREGRHSLSTIRIEYFSQIHFGDAIKALEDVIKKYNAECVEKDAQIEKFLAFCESYKA